MKYWKFDTRTCLKIIILIIICGSSVLRRQLITVLCFIQIYITWSLCELETSVVSVRSLICTYEYLLYNTSLQYGGSNVTDDPLYSHY